MAKFFSGKTNLACPKCHKMPNRICEKLPEICGQIGLKMAAYIFFDWLGCFNKKCRFYFNKIASVSRCPVCKYWSLNSIFLPDQEQLWSCLNPDCEWYLKITDG